MGLQAICLLISYNKSVIWHAWTLDAVKFDLEAMFGNDFSRRVDLDGSRGLGRAGMEVGGEGAQNTGVLRNLEESGGSLWVCKSKL